MKITFLPVLLRVWATAALLCLSGTVAASQYSPVFGSCTSNLQQSGSGLSGTVTCPLTCSDNSATGSGTVTFSGTARGTLSGSLGGNCAGSGSWTGTGSYQGYFFSCSATGGGGAAFSGTCDVTIGGVGGAASASGAQQQVQATVAQQVAAISGAVGSRMSSRMLGTPTSKQSASGSGIAAGDVANQWNAWASLSRSDTSYTPTDDGMRRAAAINNVVLGADYQLNTKTILGISAAFDRGSGSVTSAAIGTTTEGYSVAPYLGFELSPSLALDLSLGLGNGTAKQAGTLEVKSTRQFFAANIGYGRWVDDLQLTGKAGYLLSQELYGDAKSNGAVMTGTATTNRIQQLNMGFEAGYWLNGMMPYLGLTYTRDLQLKAAVTDNNWDKDAFILKAGINFFSLGKQVTGGISYTGEVSRNNAKNGTLMGNVNVKF